MGNSWGTGTPQHHVEQALTVKSKDGHAMFLEGEDLNIEDHLMSLVIFGSSLDMLVLWELVPYGFLFCLFPLIKTKYSNNFLFFCV